MISSVAFSLAVFLGHIWCALEKREDISDLGGLGAVPVCRASTEVTFGRGDLSVCPLGGFTGAQEHLISTWRGVPQGSHREKH